MVEESGSRGGRGETDTTSFITEWTTTGSDETVTWPLVEDEAMDFTIDWGDDSSIDTVTAYDDDLGEGGIDHVYADADTYTVTIAGTITGIKFNNGGDRLKLTKITQWGACKITIDDAFWGCANMDITADDAPDLSSLTGYNTGLNHCFDGCTALTSIGDPEKWDVSNIQTFQFMFRLCVNYNQDITMWDTSTCISFQSMFHSATIFNQAIGSWDTSAAASVGFPSMFQSASAFNQNLNSWDWSNNQDCWGMFHYAIAFQNGAGGNAPNWNLTKTIYFVEMFKYSNFNQDLSGCTGIGTATGSVAWFGSMFAYNTSFDQNIGHFVVSNVKDHSTYGMGSMFLGGSSGLSAANYNKTLVAWALQDATDNVNFGGDQSDADATSGSADGDTARQALIDDDSWVFTDADT